MKNVLVAVLLVAVVTGVSSQERSQTAEETSLFLTGVVTKQVTVRVEEKYDYDNLDISVDVDDLVIAEVTEVSNSGAGYTISLHSSGAATTGQPALRGTDSVSYEIKYGNNGDLQSVEFNDGTAILSRGEIVPRGGRTRSLAISYDAPDGARRSAGSPSDASGSASAGSAGFRDELTFTVSAE